LFSHITIKIKNFRILDITNKQSENMTEQTGIQASLSEQDAKEYLNEVLNAVKNLKQKND